MTLDRFDHKILDLLQVNNRLTYEELADRVNLSASACRRRVAALRKAEVIVADVAIIDRTKVGPSVSIITRLSFERDNVEAHRVFRARMIEVPEVLQCLFVAGGMNYMLHISTESVAAYEALADRLFTGDPAIKRFESLVVMNRIKATTRIPLPVQV